ncbi:MAG: glycosyltransferase family 2 protein, partial [Chthoniobacteraceae bacterium]
MEPLVLAIPTYHSARYLPATLESLKAHGGWVRWWLQDGASTDGTVEIARSLARSGDTVVSEPDGGQTDALNRAMRQMGGEIIGFLNGDDCLLPGAAQAVVEYFAEYPEVDLVCGRIQWIDEEGRVTGTHAGAIHTLEEVLDIYSVWWNDRQWVQPEVFYRRRLWEKVGGFDTGYHLAFDYDFWVRCFRAGAQVRHLPRELAQFRKHGEQKPTAAERAAEEIRTIVQKQLESGV